MRQFATLICAQIPLLQTCEILERSQTSVALRTLIFSIKNEILLGNTLSNSLMQHRIYFDDVVCQLIKIGECTGNLEKILSSIADYKEKQFAFIKKVKQALFYPGIILIMACMVLLIMFLFVIPHFKILFENSDKPLPWPTQLIFFLADQGFYAIILLLVLVSIIVIYRKKTLRLLLKLPILNSLTHKILLSRFSHNLAITLTAGLPITNALILSSETMLMPIFLNQMTIVRFKLNAGLSLHQAMQEFAIFPPLLLQMIKVGEESGKLEYMLEKFAEFLDVEIENTLRTFLQIIEPLIMVVLGVLIGGLVIGMYLPIFRLGFTL